MSILDEVDIGDKCTFSEYVQTWKRDAERQETLVTIISQILDQECRKNDLQHRSGYPNRVTVFHGSRPPNLSTRQYVERISAFSGCSPCCLIVATKYLQDLSGQDSAFALDSLNGHRLILTAVMIAAKFLDDFYYSNGYWAKVGGIPIQELNGLEMEFLFLMKFSLHIQRSTYDELIVGIIKRSKEIDAIEADLNRRTALARQNVPLEPAKPAPAAIAMMPVAMGAPPAYRRMPDGKLIPEVHHTAVPHPSMAYGGYGMRQQIPDRRSSGGYSGNVPC